MQSIQTIVYLLLFSVLSLQAQKNQSLDSLMPKPIQWSPATIKVYFLNDLFNKEQNRNPEKAKGIALTMLSISEDADYPYGTALSNHNLGNYFYDRNKKDSAYSFYNKALIKYQQIEDIEGQSAMIHNLAILEGMEGNDQKALGMLDEEIGLLLGEKSVDSLRLARAYSLKGDTYLGKGDYNIALMETLKALRIYERMKDPIGKADSQNTLSSIEYALKNYQKSINYASEALSIYSIEKDILYETEALLYIGSSYYELNAFDKALEYLQKSLQLSKEIKSPSMEAFAYRDIGKVFVKQGEIAKGIQQLQKSLQILESLNRPLDVSETLIDLGIVQVDLNQLMEGLGYFNQAISIAKTTGAKELLQTCYQQRAKVYEKLGDKKQAFADYKLYVAYKDSIFNLQTAKQLQELRTIHETDTKEGEIVLLKQNARVSNLRLLLLGAALLLSLIGFYALRQRVKRQKLEKEKLDAELDFKKKELTTHAMHLAKKNEVLENVKQKAKALRTTDSNLGYQQLIKTINFDQQDDKNWSNFIQYFEQVHTDFSSNAKRKYPDVTKNELRLMALLKMNLSSKEIATILNISPDGVKKARQRLRKKMALTPEDSLEAVVIAI